MDLEIIGMTLEEIENTGHKFLEEEKDFITQFAFKTGDNELVDKLIGELIRADSNEKSKDIIGKYSALYDVKPKWLDRIENLIVAIEMYRLEEEKAVKRIEDILSTYGVPVTVEELISAKEDERENLYAKQAVL